MYAQDVKQVSFDVGGSSTIYTTEWDLTRIEIHLIDVNVTGSEIATIYAENYSDVFQETIIFEQYGTSVSKSIGDGTCRGNNVFPAGVDIKTTYTGGGDFEGKLIITRIPDL